MKITEISNLEQFIELKNKFKSLESSTNFYQSYQFIRNYVTLYENNLSINIIEDGKDYIILPFAYFKYKLLDYCGFIGSPHISEENDLIHNLTDEKKFCELLDNFFKNSKKNFYLCNLVDGYFVRYLIRKNSFYNLRTTNANIVEINDNYYTNKKSMNKSIMYDLRKFSKELKIDEREILMNELNYEELNQDKILQFILNNKGIKNKNYSKIVTFLIKLKKYNLTKISILTWGKYHLSLIIYAINMNKLYYIIPAYNKKLKNYSFGKIHLDKLITQNKSTITELFLGPGEEKYKKKFNVNKKKLNLFTDSKILLFLTKFKNFFT